jgi:hypothetical protein
VTIASTADRSMTATGAGASGARRVDRRSLTGRPCDDDARRALRSASESDRKRRAAAEATGARSDDAFADLAG